MLLNESQIICNLRRAAYKGYISLLNQYQLEELALKYFGIKDENDNYIAYTCPYSGKQASNLILEHIIPISSKGGTVVFNCVPASSEINGKDEKGSKHLIDWWTNSKYWDNDSPYRLEKLVNYMLEAYENVFKEYSIDEVENSYLNIDLSDTSEFDDLTKNEIKENDKSLEQAKNNNIHSYLGFLLDCIKALEKYGIDTKNIHSKLDNLKERNIFEDINRFDLFQDVVQQIVKTTFGEKSQKYLTYSLNFNITKLMKSITSNNKEDIHNEILNRFNYISSILKENNISIIDYYKNMPSMEDIDIIYKDINNLTDEELNDFTANIKIGYTTKLNVFIEMINRDDNIYTSYENGKPNDNNIFSSKNKVPFMGFENIKGLDTSQFWNTNSSDINKLLNDGTYNGEESKEYSKYKDSKYDKARKAIKDYNFSNRLNNYEKIKVFIEMINRGDNIYTSYKNGKPDDNNIFSSINKIPFMGFENIKGLDTSKFWSSNSSYINELLN